MAFGWAGAAAGGQDALQEMLTQRRAAFLQQQQMQQQQAQQSAVNARAQEGLDLQRQQFDAGRADKAAAAQKDAANDQGFASLVQSLPEQVRPLVELKRRGVAGITSHDLETPQAHEAHIATDQGNEDTRKIDLYQREKQIDARYRAPAEPKSKIWVMRAGMPNYIDPGQVQPGDAPYQPRGQKTPTGADRQAFAFYNRAKQATDTIEGGGDSGTDMETQIANMGLAGQTALNVLPNFAQSQLGQSYRQAQRTFTEARLRKESGAAINDAEYAKDAKTYFAQPGDSPETIAQKRTSRKQVLEGLAFSSGPAYEEFYGEQFKATNKPAGGTEPPPAVPGASPFRVVGRR